MKFISNFLIFSTVSKRKFLIRSVKTQIGSVLYLVMLSLVLSGCGGNGDDLSKECDYYNKLKAGNAANITAKGNQAISSLQDEVIACGIANKPCVDTAIKNFGETHSCNQ